MGWEQRGTYSYYYRKEREGTRVKSTYIGRGEIAQMVSQIQSSSAVLERLLPLTRHSPRNGEIRNGNKTGYSPNRFSNSGRHSLPLGFIVTNGSGGRKEMGEEKPLNNLEDKVKIGLKFSDLLAKTNKENPRPGDVKALSDLLNGNKSLELWRMVASAGNLAELTVLENATAVDGLKECWKHRLQALKRNLGYDGAPMLEQLLIQHAALCWLKLSLVELSYSSVMRQSITLTLGIYWEKRLTAAQKRFTRACETLTRIRKLSRNTPALQVNIAAEGGQQVNLAT